jgi:hypothetical protein
MLRSKMEPDQHEENALNREFAESALRKSRCDPMDFVPEL